MVNNERSDESNVCLRTIATVEVEKWPQDDPSQIDDPFIADGLAWKQFEKTLNEEGVTAFYNKKEKRQLFH